MSSLNDRSFRRYGGLTRVIVVFNQKNEEYFQGDSKEKGKLLVGREVALLTVVVSL